MKKIFLVLFVFTAAFAFAQNKDADTFKSASATKDPAQKIEAMKKFINEFPSSNYVPRGLYEIYIAYMSLNNVDSALVYADKHINAYPVEGRANPQNSVAYTLAQKKVGLDSALAYIQRAVAFAKSRNARNIGQFLDTEALVLFEMGKFNEALAKQEEAIKGHEDDPSYLGALATYQEAAGKRSDALITGAKVIFFGDPEFLLPKWNEWIAKEKSTADDQLKLKKETAEKIVNQFVLTDRSIEEVKFSKLDAAAFYAKVGLNLDLAKQWASEALKNLKKDSPAEEKVQAHKTMGAVLAAQKDYKNALKEMELVKETVAPWDADFWMTLANIYQSLNNNQKAMDAYIACLYAYPAPPVVTAANELGKKMNLTEADIQKKIEAAQKENETFDPGKSKIKTNGNVLLAELFTGAECNPCQGADVAFDKLEEYYDRKSVAILQFHLHIPGPDPLTNLDTYDRYVYYGANFGTPTVFLNGTQNNGGGGPRSLAKNRFIDYKSTLDNQFSRKPVLSVNGTAVKKGTSIEVSFNVKGKTDTSSVLYIALTEKSVKYTGSNTIDHHIFVVRDLLSETSLNDKIEKSFEIEKIQEEIKQYLDDPTKHPSWRPTFGKPNWKARPETLDMNNLAVVAWVQNKYTKEVLNAFYIDVK